jgi:replicative DNA helicase
MYAEHTPDRIPPQSLEAEMSTLGSMLIDRDAIAKVIDLLDPEDFYKEAHRAVYEAICTLFEKGEPADLITVTEALREHGKLDRVGGAVFISSLANSVPTAANVEYYAKIVKDRAILRALVKAGTSIAASAYEASADVEVALDEAEQAIFQIAQKKSIQSYTDIRRVLVEAFERIEYLYSSKGGVTGVASGFSDLDNITSGFQPSDLIIIAGRPSMGKSAFALNIVENAALRDGVPCAVFSLEMSKEQLAQRMLCSVAGVDGQRLRTGFLRDDDWPKLSFALGKLSEAAIFVDDTPSISIMEMRAKARRIRAEHNLGLIVVDYLQLMVGKTRTESRQQEVTEISRSLKQLARELEVPVVALSQLSRAVEQRTEKIPSLADLRESGSLEQDADVVIFLYRDDYYNLDSDRKGLMDIIVAKQRNGPTGKVSLVFLKEFGRFESLEKHQRPEARSGTR